jgi:hypothetical protein
MQAIGAVLLLAVLTEWLTERFFGGLWVGKIMVGISTVIGVALCVAFKVDAIILLGVGSPWSEWVNIVVTGLIVGGGSQAIHKFFDKFIPEG